MKNRNLEHKDDWQTPPSFYNVLNQLYKFDFDPVPLHADFDCLELKKWGERNFINAPYSLKSKQSIIIDAIRRSKEEKSLMVCLLPVSTSTKLFHNHILPNISKPILFLEGRLKFIGTNDRGQLVNDPNPTNKTFVYIDEHAVAKVIPLHIKNSGQHDSMVVFFDGREIGFYSTQKV
jgi:hypothetical protein